MTADEVRKEGLADQAWASIERDEAEGMTEWFMSMWLRSHGYRGTAIEAATVMCRRIEWRYLDGEVA